MMIRRALTVVAMLATVAVTKLHAQQPTPAQAQQMLQNPELLAKLRQQLQSGAVTPDQVRARLRAAGYPPNMLDAYLSGGGDSTAMPGADVYAAVSALGLGDTTNLDSTQALTRARRRGPGDAFLDSIRTADDSTKQAIRQILASRDARRAAVDSGYTVFGTDLFQGEQTQFQPNAVSAVDANYRFGPGDQLVLILTGDVEAAYKLDVTKQGFVVVPEVGQIQVSGLTLGGLEDVLYQRLGRVYSGVRRNGGTTHFSINVAKVGTNQVFLTGDVVHPGSYTVSRAATVMNALYQAGGPSASGSLRDVEVRRGGTVVGSLDVYDYALSGDASHDIRLENGDIVFVPTRGSMVRLAGPVVRPATYELKQGETLADLLRMSGGFTPSADRRRVQIERILPASQRTSTGTDRRFIDVSSDLLRTGYGPPEPLQNGDVVRVFGIPNRVTHKVVVQGNVWTPGTVAFTPGMQLSDALRRAGGLRPDSYLGQVLVSRMRPDSSREMLRAAVRDTTGTTEGDIPLADGDEIQVFSLTQFRPSRYVTISGAVKKPGQIPYRDGMTLRDLVLLAGGLEESALLTQAEIARLPESRAAGVTAQTIRVPLDSTYLFERDSDGRYLGPPGLAAPAGHSPDVPLEPYDAVLILRQPDWQLQRSVYVEGEVKYPGQYSLKSKNEKVADVIDRAGGLTRTAYANGVVFVRKLDGVGRIGIDLPKVLKHRDSPDNLALLDGDSIFIPTYQAVVSVKGAVNSPVSVAYVPGADIDYYIASAGGGNNKADLKHAYVTQGNGKVESRHRYLFLINTRPRPEPGSTVVVPEKEPLKITDWISLMSATTSILGSLVAIVAIMKK